MTERPTCHTTHPTPPRSDDPRVERTRAAVIEAASDLLMADGPSAITHANVAAAANVSRTTVYNHWPTQADLLRDTIESLGKVPLRRDQLTGSLRSDLDLLCGHVVQDLADDQRAPMIVNMMERALHDPTVASVRDEFLDAFADVFHTIVQTAIDAGELRTDIDAGRSMAALLGSFLFARFMSADDFGPDFAAAVLDDFVSVNAPR
jgi:TetR/AcrR family transcriptional regulator of autoinduction and epiphytic fitness